MSLGLDYDRLLTQFDSLVSGGVVKHHASRAIEVEDNGFRFKYEVTESLAGKPAAESAPEPASASRPETFGPGSDIVNAHPDLLVTTINETHLLVFNKFAVFRPHLLLLTVDSYQRQPQPLDEADLRAAWTLLTDTNDRFYIIFNCGVNAGASRSHKHLQVLPYPDSFPSSAHTQRWRLFPDYEPPLPEESIPFKYFIHHLGGSAMSGSDLFHVYRGLLHECRHALNILDAQTECPHNVVLTRKWIVTIPRSRENVDGTTANSAGMMGSVWLRSQQQLEKWLIQGPGWVLSQLGLPAGRPQTIRAGEDSGAMKDS